MFSQFINAVRSILLRSKLLRYVAGQERQSWTRETVTPVQVGVLKSRLDILTAQHQVLRYRQELDDAFANQRDLTYGTRGRLWLMTRGKQTELERQVYHRWMDSCRRNPRADSPAMLAMTEEELTTAKPEDLLK